MPPTKFKIDLEDGTKAWVIARGEGQKRAVIYLPWYGGDPERDAVPRDIGRHLDARNIAFYGLRCFGYGEDIRNFPSLTLEQTVNDTIALSEELKRRGVEEIHLVVHSYTAYVALMVAKQSDLITSVVLLDGSKPNDSASVVKNFELHPEFGYWHIADVGVYVDPEHIRSILDFKIEDYLPLNTPVFAIEAGANQFLKGSAAEYCKHLTFSRQLVIPGIGHVLVDNDEGFERLLEEIHNWIDYGHKELLAQA